MPRMVEVVDRRQSAAVEGGGAAAKPAREKADPVMLGSVGCPMSGQVIEVVAKPGESAFSTPYVGASLDPATAPSSVVATVR